MRLFFFLLAFAALPLCAQSNDALRAYVLKYYKVAPDVAKDFQYEEARVDLNGDGKQEIVICLTTPNSCGTGGCNMLVLTQRGKSFDRILWTTIVHPPIRVLDRSALGWKSLAVTMCGGGIIQCYEREFRFDGKRYSSDSKPLNGNLPGQIVIGSQQ